MSVRPSAERLIGAVSTVAYLTNQYPAPSHSFIRREIRALESLGWAVRRFSHRRVCAPLVDIADQDEAQLTCVLLDSNPQIFLAAFWHWLRTGPWQTLRTLAYGFAHARTGDRRWRAHLGYFGLACVLSRRLQQLGFPHLHVHFGTNASDVACLCRQLCGLTYSMTWHGPHEFDEPNRLNLADKIAGASFVVLVSDAGHETTRTRYRESAAKLKTIRCGLDASWFALSTTAIPRAARLVCVARLDDQKNPLLLIDAAALLVARGQRFVLTMAGDGALRAHVERRIAEHQLEACVTVAGWCTQQEVIRHLQESRALVLSSHDEGLPVAVMESFAVGRVAIAPDVGAVHELVETGVTGWLVAAQDPTALADAMEACLNASPEYLQGLAANAKQRVQAHRIEVAAAMLAEAFLRVSSA